MSTDQRAQKRFEVDAAIAVVAVETQSGHIQPRRIEGKALNVSASGALLQVSEPLTTKRIWIRLTDTDPSLSECIVVREAGPNHYGVQFRALWPASTIHKLLSAVYHPLAVG